MPASDSFTISVVIPLYNKERAIGTTVRAVLRQTRPPDEIIIVDDGSSDASIPAVGDALVEEKCSVAVRVISQKNMGVSVARNRGADEATSRYIAFLDADDEWLPSYLAEMEKLAAAYPQAGVLTIRYGRLDRSGQIVPEPTGLHDSFFGIIERFLDIYRRGYGIISSSSVAIRSDAWQRCGGFPAGARKSQDMLLWLKLGLSETIAHSGRTLSIWHDEHSGVVRRRGAVPEHLRYFLGTCEGRSNLGNRDLANFLASNMVIQIASHRILGDLNVAREVRQLSVALPASARLKCLAASAVPIGWIRTFASLRRRSRGLHR